MKQGWEIKKLGEVCRFINGRAYSQPELLKEGKYPVLRVGNFYTNRDWYYSDLELPEDKYCDKGDLLYAWSASFGPRIWDGQKVIYHYHIWKVEPNEKLIRKDFLFQLLEWDTEAIKTAHGTGTTMMHVGKGSIENRKIPLPPLPEQQRIVSILNEAFAAIAKAKANAQQNLQNAKELFECYLQGVFENKGEGWEEKTLGELFDIGSSKRIMEKDWTVDGVPFYGGKEIVKLAKFGFVISNNYISEDKYNEYASKYDMPQLGDILITARGTIGIGYIVKKGDKFYYKDGNIISMRAKIPTNPEFILYALKSKVIYDQFEKLTGATVSHLPIEKAKLLILMTPNFPTQNTVVQKIQELEAETKKLEAIYQQKINDLEELKKSVLQKAFNGELNTSKILV